MVEITGGTKLANALARISENVTNAASVKVGFLAGSTEEDGTSIPLIAAIQNFGAPSRGIPPRPFFSSMVREKRGEWGPLTAAALKANNMDARKALEAVGETIKGELMASIVATTAPPLAASTIRARGGKGNEVFNRNDPKTFVAKPLVDTGTMLNSVGVKVT